MVRMVRISPIFAVEMSDQPVARQPLVSVVVVTYQHAGFIAQCLDGILMQKTSFPVEILVGEDESTDGTREICAQYAAEHPDRIRLFLRSRKDVIQILGRPSGRANFMHLLSEAKGKYVALCEGDDFWTDPQKLQKQVDFLEAHPDFELCFHRVLARSRIQGKPDRLLPDKVTKEEFSTEDLIGPYFMHTSSLVYRRPDPSDLPAWFRTTMSGDIPLLFLLSLKGKFKLIDGVMSVWRQHNNSVSAHHLGYDRVRGMIHMYELLNAHTNFRYNDLFRSAFILELGQLPEMAELKELRHQVMPFSKKIRYFVRNRFSWLRSSKTS